LILLGLHFTTNDGQRRTTLHVKYDFKSFYNNLQNGRGCIGERVEEIYIGDYDISGLDLEVGSEIEVYFDKGVQTSKGIFQPVKKVELLN